MPVTTTVWCLALDNIIKLYLIINIQLDWHLSGAIKKFEILYGRPEELINGDSNLLSVAMSKGSPRMMIALSSSLQLYA